PCRPSWIAVASSRGAVKDLGPLLRPRSVAVIGASDDPRTFSGAPVFNLQRHGFAGPIYPVNPKRSELRGLRCFPSVLDVPDPVEAAVVAVPSGAVMSVLSECVRK